MAEVTAQMNLDAKVALAEMVFLYLDLIMLAVAEALVTEVLE